VIKSLERAGRRLLILLLSLLLGRKPKPVRLGPKPKILVVRLDERVGNLIMTIPLLQSLRQRFPHAQIDLLANAKGMPLLGGLPSISRYIVFDKRALFAIRGPLAMPVRLRNQGYDLAIDCSNPTDPSVTQTILMRLSGAQHTVGPSMNRYKRLYTAAAQINSTHEIDMRLDLLNAVPGDSRVTEPLLPGNTETLRKPRTALLNVGARTSDKRLTAQDYAAVARAVSEQGWDVRIIYGPGESSIATAVAEAAPQAMLFPPTDLVQLSETIRRSNILITCDTGPMHLGPATETPTCGLFVSTEPERYGYNTPPHCTIDARDGLREAQLQGIRDWLDALA